MAKDLALPVDAVSLFDELGGEVEVLQDDLGEPVDFDSTPTFAGFYTGTHLTIAVPAEKALNNEDYTANQYGFTDIETGKKRAIWGNYQIDRAMEEVAYGDAVLFQFLGRRPIDNGRRQLAAFEIRVKRVR